MRLGIYQGGWYKAHYIEQKAYGRVFRLGLLGLPWNWQENLGLGVIFNLYRDTGKFHIRILWIGFGWIKEGQP